jgi:hypothetical protein
LALFRIAAAAGVLLVLAPEQSRQAIGAIFGGARDAARAVPTGEEAADAAIAYCRTHPDVCAKAVRKAAEAERRIRP